MRKCWFGLLTWLALSAHAVVVLHDDRQQVVRLDAPPQRIVSLLPSLTETVCALGQCQRLVGVDRYSNWPESVGRLPRVGGGIDPNIEAVVALQPDLVLMASSARGAERLQALGIKVLSLEPKSHADVQRVMRTVGQALGVPATETDRVWWGMLREVSQIAQTLPAKARNLRVYIEVSPAPYGASASSFLGETLQRLGPRNILGAELGPFPNINPELVVREQPDVIIAADSSKSSMLARPGWSKLRAVREGRLCTHTADESDVLVRPGPRMAEAARLMARCFQGGT
jgi:iron complex transport system substrate-binding protein